MLLYLVVETLCLEPLTISEEYCSKCKSKIEGYLKLNIFTVVWTWCSNKNVYIAYENYK